MSIKPLLFKSTHAKAPESLFTVPSLSLSDNNNSTTFGIPSSSLSKSTESSTPSPSKSHKVCLTKISSMAKSFPCPPGASLLNLTVN